MSKYRIVEIDGERSVIAYGAIQFIHPNPKNRHSNEYAEWLAQGNKPEQPTPIPVDTSPTIEERLKATETLINLLLDEGGV